MGKIHLGVNMEFVRHDDKPFEWGVLKAAEIGYEFVEPISAAFNMTALPRSWSFIQAVP